MKIKLLAVVTVGLCCTLGATPSDAQSNPLEDLAVQKVSEADKQILAQSGNDKKRRDSGKTTERRQEADRDGGKTEKGKKQGGRDNAAAKKRPKPEQVNAPVKEAKKGGKQATGKEGNKPTKDKPTKAEKRARKVSKAEAKERKKHLKRLAQIDRLAEVAQANGNAQLAQRVGVLRKKEITRHEAALLRLANKAVDREARDLEKKGRGEKDKSNLRPDRSNEKKDEATNRKPSKKASGKVEDGKSNRKKGEN